jgi:hypothetical protein
MAQESVESGIADKFCKLEITASDQNSITINVIESVT